MLLQLLYSVRSERLLMEQLDYNLLFRWFVGLSMDDRVWDASTFSKNRERMLEGDLPKRSFKEGWEKHGPGSCSEHFLVDGTLLEAGASHKSFRPVDPVTKDKNDKELRPPAARWDENNPTVNYRGEKRSNQTHCSVWRIVFIELDAIIFWDWLYLDNPAPDLIERDACVARLFRRVQVVLDLSRVVVVTS